MALPVLELTLLKTLGVIFDSKFTFKEHITYVVGRGNQSWGFISRSTKSFQSPVM